MCGYLFYASAADVISREVFDGCRDLLAHRGPDAAQTVSLRDGRVHMGHRRLSILDLSDSANQPMRLGGLWVVYNGEVYNYPDLKRELESRGSIFHTHCDTEVLLHGYQAWGEDLPNHLVGMFSFCIWDDAKGRLFGARDHAGQKPFFYRCDRRRLMIASEVKAILPLLSTRPKIRRESIKDFFVFDEVPDPYTWYDGIMSLPPGHSLSVSVGDGVGQPNRRAYWTFRPPEKPLQIRSREAMEHAGDLLERSVKLHQLADVEVGAFLSGGLDSAGVVALEASQRQDPVRTFTVGYVDDAGEIPLARQVAERWRCRHTEALFDRHGMDAAFDRSFDLFDSPFGDASQFPTYEVSRLAAKGVKVVLTGDGGDEVFGGYWNLGKYMGGPPLRSWRPSDVVNHIRHHAQLRAEWQATLNFGHSPERSEVVDMWLGPELADLKDYDPMPYYMEHWLPELDPFRRAQWLDFKTYLPEVLKKVDRCAMAHSLEARCPMLLPELVEFAFSLPVEVKNPGGRFKHLYKEWLKSRRLVPLPLFKAPKKGFAVSYTAARHIRSDESKLRLFQEVCDAGWFNGNAKQSVNEHWGRLWRFALISRALMES
ncbi:MAG TPA: asparagine synthase (glutamine-hydrolyzing) [Kiritimatiellia bacterium]|nr:asparagine synthase (glutamine-hydrolyzing) [Kiritimatiellia bacterium]